MTLAPWRSPLSRALHRNRSLTYARYLQLATVRADGRPANRTVVFRGFWADSNQLKFITDARSDKFDQIQQQPWAEICWYFPKTREQFRLLGRLILISAAQQPPELLQARMQSWQDLSDTARQQFLWPDPKQPKAEAEVFSASNADPAQPPDHFCLLLLNPVEVDHLELRGNPQDRHLYKQLDHPDDQQWSVQFVNP